MVHNKSDIHINWLKGIREKNRQILELIFKEFKPLVLLFITRRGASKKDAEDVFMDVIEAIYRKTQETPDDFFDSSKFEQYLKKACRFQWYNKCRRNKFESGVTIEELELPDGKDFIIDELIQTEQSNFLWKKIHELGKKCQEVLKRFITDGESLQQIADAMGYTYDYAKKKKYKCNKELVVNIKADHLYEELKN